MKNKSWIIILIMGIALSISIGYSVYISKENARKKDTVTTTSIIEMTATTATIKNTLKGAGVVEIVENKLNIENTLPNNEALEQNIEQESQTSESVETITPIEKKYKITLNIEEKDFSKVKENQVVEIAIQKDNKTLNYIGKVVKNADDVNSKSKINVEITNPDENLVSNMQATCVIIIEKAENVVALPIEAIQKDENQKEYVNLVIDDETTEKRYVKTGLSDDYYVEISSGLNVGDRVQIIKSSTTVVNEAKNTVNSNITK